MSKIAQIRIQNILGIEFLEHTLGNFTVIEGKNGTGKTSVLNAIKAAIGGGKDAHLLRKGETEGEIILILDDGLRLHKSVTSEKQSLSVITPEGYVLNAAQTHLNSLYDAISFNPVDFLLAKPKDRLAILLEACPISVPEQVKLKYKDVPTKSVDGLDYIDEVRKYVYDHRTGVNRLIKEKTSTINQLKTVVQDVQDVDHLLEEKKKIETEIAELQIRLGAINSQIEESKKAQNTFKMIEDLTKELSTLQGDEQHDTNNIKELDQLKLDLLNNLPIAGITIEDGEIFIDNIPFDKLNTAKQVEFTLSLATLRAGELKLVCVDRLECLDDDQLEVFKAKAEESGLQLIVTKVTNTPFNVFSNN